MAVVVRNVAAVVVVAVVPVVSIVDTRALQKAAAAAGCYSYSSHDSFHWDETVK